MITIKHCVTDSDFLQAVQITRDYMTWLDMNLDFQNVDKEFQEFSTMYSNPHGLFLLAWKANKVAGGVGLRLHEPGVCEMKRLYVYEQYKGKGVGRKLCQVLITEAENIGYKKMLLDTLERLNAATSLYRSLGFKEIAPYRYNPDPTVIYMQLDLK